MSISLVTLSGSIALITSFIGLLPQIVKAIKTQSTTDLSMLMLINYFICSLAWIIYGSTTSSFFVLSANVVGLVVSVALIFLKKYYDSQAYSS